MTFVHEVNKIERKPFVKIYKQSSIETDESICLKLALYINIFMHLPKLFEQMKRRLTDAIHWLSA